MRGKASAKEVPDFHARLDQFASEGLTNVSFGGRYRAPEDLAGIYGELDLVWAGDFMEAGFNSEWLLPNRIYEGGYHAVPPVAPAGTETARWIEDRGVGFALPEDLASTLPALIARLIANRTAINERRDRLRKLEDKTFVAERGEFSDLFLDVLRESSPNGPAAMHQSSTRETRNLGGLPRRKRAAGE